MGLIIEIVAISIECQNKQFQISSAQQAQIKFNEITIIVPGVCECEWVWIQLQHECALRVDCITYCGFS